MMNRGRVNIDANFVCVEFTHIPVVDEHRPHLALEEWQGALCEDCPLAKGLGVRAAGACRGEGDKLMEK